MKDNTKDLKILYEYEVKIPPPTDYPNTPSQNRDYVNSTPEEQICNIKAKLVALKSFVVEQIYVLKKRLEEKEVSPEGSNLLKLFQEKISYLREKNKGKSEIIKMLSDRQNTYHRLHTNTTDTRKRNNRSRHYTNKPTKTTDSWTSTDISNNKTNHDSPDGNSLIISQLHHPSKEIMPKRIKENIQAEIFMIKQKN